MEKAKIEKLKCDILSNFQTLWAGNRFPPEIVWDLEFAEHAEGQIVLHLYHRIWMVATEMTNIFRGKQRQLAGKSFLHRISITIQTLYTS